MKRPTLSIFFAILFSFILFSPSTAQAYTNVVTNGGGETGDTSGWSNVSSGLGRIWSFGGARTGSRGFTSSFYWTSMDQRIDLLDAGYTTEELDAAPDINFRMWIRSTSNGVAYTPYDQYYFTVELRDGSNNPIETYNRGSEGSPITLQAADGWTPETHTFSSYGTGVRYVYVKIGGIDSGFWAGNYGAHFDDISVNLDPLANPTISTLSPLDNDTDVTSPALVINFDEPVIAGTGSIVIRKVSDDSIVETISADSDSVTRYGTDDGAIQMTINTTGLEDNTEYYVNIDGFSFYYDYDLNYYFGGISDSTSWNFTTDDITSPTVLSFSPADDSTNISISSNLVITFSEDIETASGALIYIYKSSDDSLVETINSSSDGLDVSGSIVTINPSSNFAYNTSYYVQIDSSAFMDAVSHTYVGIDDSTTWNFTTRKSSSTRRQEVEDQVTTTGTTSSSSTSTSTPISSSGSSGNLTINSVNNVDESNQPQTQTQTQTQTELNTDDTVPFTDIENHWSKEYVMNLYRMGAINGYADKTFGPDKFITRAEIVKIVSNLFKIDGVSNTTKPKLKDITSGMWYTDLIDSLYHKGIVSGYSDGNFYPGRNISRVEALKILLMASGLNFNTDDSQASFSDTNKTDWFMNYISFASSNHIMEGYKNGKFMPNNPITRGEIAKIAWLIYGMKN